MLSVLPCAFVPGLYGEFSLTYHHYVRLPQFNIVSLYWYSQHTHTTVQTLIQSEPVLSEATCLIMPYKGTCGGTIPIGLLKYQGHLTVLVQDPTHAEDTTIQVWFANGHMNL